MHSPTGPSPLALLHAGLIPRGGSRARSPLPPRLLQSHVLVLGSDKGRGRGRVLGYSSALGWGGRVIGLPTSGAHAGPGGFGPHPVPKIPNFLLSQPEPSMPNTALLIKNPLAATHEFKQACQLCYPKTGNVHPHLGPSEMLGSSRAWTPRMTGPRVPVRDEAGTGANRETVWEVGLAHVLGGRPAAQRVGPGCGVRSPAACGRPCLPTGGNTAAPVHAPLSASHGVTADLALHPGGKGAWERTLAAWP